MTSVKKNDFGEGILDSDEGFQITWKNIESKHVLKTDTDVETKAKIFNDLVKSAVFPHQIWLGPNEEEGRKYGRFELVNNDLFEVTFKDIEAEPKTYHKLWFPREKCLEVLKKYGLRKPKWVYWNKESSRYEKVKE